MKQLLILSGKGGTGKTTVAGAFIQLSQAKAYADCDVDAPNLHLILSPSGSPQKKDFFGMPKAKIDPSRCTACGRCIRHCKFDAIAQDLTINSFACEGCGLCEALCPANAISLIPAVSGYLMLYRNPETVFSTAQLKMGSGASGLLVTEVKKQLTSSTAELAIIDGSPGIGCPVIASLSGADLVLIVAEPSLSGISDMKRIIKTADIFHTKIAVCINKFDINATVSQQIKDYCVQHNLIFVGEIPFDATVMKAINHGLSVIDFDCPASREIKNVFSGTMQILLTDGTVV